MRTLQVIAVCMVATLPASCSEKAPAQADDLSEKNGAQQETKAESKAAEKVLFVDPMTENWQKNWFLDGQKATLEHRDGGLYFAAGTVTKKQDPENYHAHHAVLWTKQVFEDHSCPIKRHSFKRRSAPCAWISK